MIFKNNDVAFAIIAACNLSKYCIKTLEMDDKNFSNQILQGFTATDGEQKPCDMGRFSVEDMNKGTVAWVHSDKFNILF